MKKAGYVFILTVILVPCLFMLTFAVEKAKVVQATELNTMIVYNNNEVNLESSPYLIEGREYIPLNALAALFGKNIVNNRDANIIYISDTKGSEKDSLKWELAAKDKTIAELQEKLKSLEEKPGAGKRLSISALQDQINKDFCEYEDVSYKVILSGNEDEVRVKVEVDLSLNKVGWGKLNSNGRKEMIRHICNPILAEYGYPRINGYVKDISGFRKLITFCNNYEGEIIIGNYKNYSAIGVLEDKFNNDYDDHFKGIHLTYGLKGNENRVEFTAYIHNSKYGEKWDKLSDNNIRAFMKRLCSEIQKNEFSKSHIEGHIYDIDSGSCLASCEMTSGRNFSFERQ